jgi:hypothetical protein
VTPWLNNFYKMTLKSLYAKMKKSIFSIENANITQIFLLDKLVSPQRFLMIKNIFVFYFIKTDNFYSIAKIAVLSVP